MSEMMTEAEGLVRDRLEQMAAAANEAELRWMLGEWLTELRLLGAGTAPTRRPDWCSACGRRLPGATHPAPTHHRATGETLGGETKA